MRTIQFLAIILTALELVPTGAHFFELPHKMASSEAQYFTVQGIYRGWALFGIVLIAAIVSDLILAVLLRGQRLPFWLTLFALLAMAATLAVFFAWTYPANIATQNWTTTVANWQALRVQWEYSHAANAVITFLSLCALTAAALTTRR